MDHRPFENWLLNDERLTPEQERELRLHLRDCPKCDSLARANLALRAAPVVAPASGFALRFQARLAAQRKIQRRRAIFGSIVLGLSGLGLLLWLASPYLPLLANSPADLFAMWLSAVLYLSTTLQAIGIIVVALGGAVRAFVPFYAWALLAFLFTGMALLWIVSFKKFGQVPQRARQAQVP